MGRSKENWLGLWIALAFAACGSTQSTTKTTVTGGQASILQDTVDGVRKAAAAREAEEEDEDSDSEDRARKKKSSRKKTKIVSYEDAMAQPIEMGDVTLGGGEAQLTGDQIAQEMDDHLDEMYDECVERELRRGSELGTVTFDLVIRGQDGAVFGATIQPARRRFHKCLEGVLQTVRFPTFSAPRMGARYQFHTG